jgi:hypothetical protein
VVVDRETEIERQADTHTHTHTHRYRDKETHQTVWELSAVSPRALAMRTPTYPCRKNRLRPSAALSCQRWHMLYVHVAKAETQCVRQHINIIQKSKER